MSTIRITIENCSNWPLIVLAKLGVSNGPKVVRLRDGFELEIIRPLKSTWGEIFEPAIADVYGASRDSPDLIVDVGANIGAFACRAAFLHPSAAVHAFEPSERHAKLLRKNVALNRLENVLVHEQAVTKDGRQVTYSHLGSGGSSGIFLHENRTSAIMLKSVSLDEIDFTTSTCVFIKLDCEGAEAEIIEWICENLNQLPNYIRLACEYHPWCPVEIGESLRLLRAHGFCATEKTLFDESYLFASLN